MSRRRPLTTLRAAHAGRENVTELLLDLVAANRQGTAIGLCSICSANPHVIETTIRHNRGQEIGAACGQLAAERAGEPSAPAVARRRAILVTASAAALRGERSAEPAPAGVGEE